MLLGRRGDIRLGYHVAALDPANCVDRNRGRVCMGRCCVVPILQWVNRFRSDSVRRLRRDCREGAIRTMTRMLLTKSLRSEILSGRDEISAKSWPRKRGAIGAVGWWVNDKECVLLSLCDMIEKISTLDR